MEFGIDVKGMDEINKALNDLKQGVKPHELDHWASKIESMAKQFCNDKKDDIELKALGKELRFHFKDKESRDCLIRAIGMNLGSMPLLLQGVFKKLADDLRSGSFN